MSLDCSFESNGEKLVDENLANISAKMPKGSLNEWKNLTKVSSFKKWMINLIIEEDNKNVIHKYRAKFIKNITEEAQCLFRRLKELSITPKKAKRKSKGEHELPEEIQKANREEEESEQLLVEETVAVEETRAIEEVKEENQGEMTKRHEPTNCPLFIEETLNILKLSAELWKSIGISSTPELLGEESQKLNEVISKLVLELIRDFATKAKNIKKKLLDIKTLCFLESEVPRLPETIRVFSQLLHLVIKHPSFSKREKPNYTQKIINQIMYHKPCLIDAFFDCLPFNENNPEDSLQGLETCSASLADLLCDLIIEPSSLKFISYASKLFDSFSQNLKAVTLPLSAQARFVFFAKNFVLQTCTLKLQDHLIQESLPPASYLKVFQKIENNSRKLNFQLKCFRFEKNIPQMTLGIIQAFNSAMMEYFVIEEKKTMEKKEMEFGNKAILVPFKNFIFSELKHFAIVGNIEGIITEKCIAELVQAQERRKFELKKDPALDQRAPENIEEIGTAREEEAPPMTFGGEVVQFSEDFQLKKHPRETSSGLMETIRRFAETQLFFFEIIGSRIDESHKLGLYNTMLLEKNFCLLTRLMSSPEILNNINTRVNIAKVLSVFFRKLNKQQDLLKLINSRFFSLESQETDQSMKYAQWTYGFGLCYNLVEYFVQMEKITSGNFSEKISNRGPFKQIMGNLLDTQKGLVEKGSQFIAKRNSELFQKFVVYITSDLAIIFSEVEIKQKEILAWEELERNVQILQNLSPVVRKGKEQEYKINRQHYKFFLSFLDCYYELLLIFLKNSIENALPKPILASIFNHLINFVNSLSSFQERTQKMKKSSDYFIPHSSTEPIEKKFKVILELLVYIPDKSNLNPNSLSLHGDSHLNEAAISMDKPCFILKVWKTDCSGDERGNSLEEENGKPTSMENERQANKQESLNASGLSALVECTKEWKNKFFLENWLGVHLPLLKTQIETEIDNKRIDEESLKEPPEEFVDHITRDTMVNPIRLGAYMIDRSTFQHFLVLQQPNPFTREPLNESSGVPDLELQRKIEEWRETQSKRKK